MGQQLIHPTRSLFANYTRLDKCMSATEQERMSYDEYQKARKEQE